MLTALLTTLVTLVPLPMQTVTEWAGAQIADLRTLLIKGAALVITALAVWRCAKSNFALGAIIMTLIVGALAYWVILGGGIDVVAQMMSEQAKPKA